MKAALFFAFIFLVSLPVRAEEARFFSALGDVPLAAPLAELPDRSIVFDKPDGRIAEATALLDKGQDPTDIEAFYGETLPQMGWKKAASGGRTWHREGQTLTIRQSVEGEAVLFIFSLKPV